MRVTPIETTRCLASRTLGSRMFGLVGPNGAARRRMESIASAFRLAMNSPQVHVAAAVAPAHLPCAHVTPTVAGSRRSAPPARHRLRTPLTTGTPTTTTSQNARSHAAPLTAPARSRATGVGDRWPERSRAAARARRRPVDHDMPPRHRGAGTPRSERPAAPQATREPDGLRVAVCQPLKAPHSLDVTPSTPPRKSSTNCGRPAFHGQQGAWLVFRRRRAPASQNG